MSRLRDSLKKLIGRTKENMDTFYIGIGGLFFPSALALFILIVESNNLNTSDKTIMSIFSIIFALISITCWVKAYNISKAKDNLMLSKFTVETTGEKSTITELKSINKNIKILIHEIGKYKNKN